MTAAVVADPPAQKLHIGSLAAAIGVGALSAIGFSLAVPAVALNLDDWGLSRGEIGFFTTAAGVSTVLFTPAAPWLLRRFAVQRICFVAAWAAALLLLAYPTFPHPAAWFVIRFLMSAVLTLLFVCSETWIIELAPPKRRSLIIGIYASVLAGCYGVGGLIMAGAGHQGYPPFAIGAAAFAIGSLALLLPGPGAAKPDANASGLGPIFSAAKLAPLVILAPFVMASIEVGLFNLGPIYARDIGLSDTAAALVITAMAAGNVALQAPIGLAADRFGPFPVLIAVTAMAILGPFLIHFAGAQELSLFAALFFYSGFVTGFYTMGLALMARRFEAGQIATANAAFAMSYGAGQLSSPMVAGPAMDALGPQGLLWALAAIAGLFALGLILRPQDAR